MRFMHLAIVLVSISCFAGDTLPPAENMESGHRFIQTVQTHITAIGERDLETLLSTVTRDERLTLVFPDGTTLYTREEYVAFHTAWFADETWVMNIEILSQQVRGDSGVALVRTTYTDTAGPRQAMLALHFHLEQGEWRLFFDQNTRIVDGH